MYGQEPRVLGEYKIDVKEMMFYMYLPIKLKGSNRFNLTYLPERLKCFSPLVSKANEEFLKEYGRSVDKYIYITVKHVFVTPDNPGNRPGWHCDGFGTNDINYIWTDRFPTIFNIDNIELNEDCQLSMTQMDYSCKEENNITYPVNSLLRLDQFNIHKCPELKQSGMRTFVKISYSNEKYNLEGNSHNYLLDYEWEMHSRDKVRNHPTNKEADHV